MGRFGLRPDVLHRGQALESRVRDDDLALVDHESVAQQAGVERQRVHNARQLQEAQAPRTYLNAL